MELTAAKITELRTRKGWSKSELARQSGLHVSTVSQIENGRLAPYPGQIAKLEKAFGLEPEKA